jgi:type II secretory pathway component GspD/PulD (secretin)
MKMKTHTTSILFGALVLACLAGLAVHAQQQVEDQDLLNMLEQVNQKSTAPESGEAPGIDPNPESVGAVVAPALEGSEKIAAEAADDNVDDLNMSSYDDAAGSSNDNLISVRLNRVGLEEAINLFAQLSGANIIVPELTEAAQISVNLKDVEWRPALQSILDTYNYELFQKVSGSNVFSVRRRPAGAPEPQVVETFMLRYATVPNAAALVRDLLPEDAKISEFASRNMMVVKSTESSLSEIRSVLESIDVVRQQVYIESKFMELSNGNQLDLGFDWKQLGLNDQGEGGLSAKVGSSIQTYADGRQISSLGPADPVPNFSEHIFTSVLDVDQFNLVLTALESDRGVDVVSNPKIIVANEELANISIIRREPNLKQERQQTAGAQGGAAIDNIVFTLDPDMPFFEFGIKLDVRPSINTTSNITVSIKPSLTRKFGDKAAGENTYPIIDEKTVETVFNLASGQTAAIGGLTEVTDSEKERKVPYLGSIPLVGRLFSWKQTISDQTETIIFVTVGLANTQEMNLETGLPEDSELARRRMIEDADDRRLRDLRRQNYEASGDDELDALIDQIQRKEDERVEKREKALQKEAEKAAKRTQEENSVS